MRREWLRSRALSAGNGIFGCGDQAPEIAQRDNELPQRLNGAEPIAEIPAQTASLSPTGKYPVRRDWVVEIRWIETGCPPLSLSNESPVGARNGNFQGRDRATKSASSARICTQRPSQLQNHAYMSLTARTYFECLFTPQLQRVGGGHDRGATSQ